MDALGASLGAEGLEDNVLTTYPVVVYVSKLCTYVHK